MEKILSSFSDYIFSLDTNKISEAIFEKVIFRERLLSISNAESEVAFILAAHFSIISRVIPNGILKFLHIALSC